MKRPSIQQASKMRSKGTCAKTYAEARVVDESSIAESQRASSLQNYAEVQIVRSVS